MRSVMHVCVCSPEDAYVQSLIHVYDPKGEFSIYLHVR